MEFACVCVNNKARRLNPCPSNILIIHCHLFYFNLSPYREYPCWDLSKACSLTTSSRISLSSRINSTSQASKAPYHRRHLRTARISPCQVYSITCRQNGGAMNAIETNGRLNAQKCGSVPVLPFFVIFHSSLSHTCRHALRFLKESGGLLKTQKWIL